MYIPRIWNTSIDRRTQSTSSLYYYPYLPAYICAYITTWCKSNALMSVQPIVATVWLRDVPSVLWFPRLASSSLSSKSFKLFQSLIYELEAYEVWRGESSVPSNLLKLFSVIRQEMLGICSYSRQPPCSSYNRCLSGHTSSAMCMSFEGLSQLATMLTMISVVC
jgi:hypothetical protein